MAYVAVTWFMSCGKDELFDKERYRFFIQATYPVDTLESDHPWTLLTRHWVSVTANINDTGIRELRLYDDNPIYGTSARFVDDDDI